MTKTARLFFIMILALLIGGVANAATTGKIAGVITDAEAGEPLAGVNVVLQGTSLGAATDGDGQYVILNVPPGNYTLRAFMIGYATYSVSDLRVEIDQTTNIDIQMQQEAIAGQQIEVVAERKVIKRDVAASQRSVTSEEIAALPATSVGDVLGMKAGINADLSIRGSQAGEAIFMVDGIVLRDQRNNEPVSGLPLSSMQEVSVQTGGFDAEYNNVRSGVVNVVTKEGNADYYSGTVTVRYSPASQKHFGRSPFNPDAYWVRPYLDDDVAWTGTGNGAWDQHMLRQYPEFRGGWQGVSRESLLDDNPNNDLTPYAAQRLFKWQYRKKGWIQQPDRTVDFGFGGPVPVLKTFGNTRFYLSHRNVTNMYLWGLSRDGMYDSNTMLKVTSDINESTKLSVIGIYGEMDATTESRSGGTDYMNGVYDVAAHINRTGFTVPWRIYTDEYWSKTTRYFNTVSAKLTHIINSGEFYEVQFKRIGKIYRTGPSALRDTSQVYEVIPGHPGYYEYEDEAPKGFWPNSQYSVDGNLAFGGAISTARDNTEFTTYTGKFDYTNQINFRHQMKTGIEIAYNNYNMDFGMVNLFLPEGNTWTSFERNPYRITGYIQDKIEYEGFITKIGLVPEYIDSNGDWYDVAAYSREFYSANFTEDQEGQFKNDNVTPKFYLSPRIGVSHPITENSKLYFNYGHYRQMPTSETHYRMQRSAINQVDYIGNPTIPLARTVAYELGYDHALFNMYLLHISAYYKSIDNQQDWTQYISVDGKVNYYKLTAKNYEDIRGFEIEISKNFGRWVTGNANYEYRVGTSGYFGVKRYFENPAEQREYLRQNPYQSKPRPRPQFKSYVDFHTPNSFGPKMLGVEPFGGWHLNVITEWTAGFWTTWNPNSISGIEYNLQYRDFKNLDLKISKAFELGNSGTTLKFFAEIGNALNIKYFSNSSFIDVHDYEDYMYSLHLPKKVTDKLGYKGIAGDDRPGDYRVAGADYQPMDYVEDYTALSNPDTRTIYYDGMTESYMQYTDGNWNEVSNSKINQIKDNRAYINMPNQSFYTFLQPRDIFFGITISKSFR